MIERFLRYSLERGVRICAVLSQNGNIRKTNLKVISFEEGAHEFEAFLPGRKKPVRLPVSDILTACYARGDHGELEDLT